MFWFDYRPKRQKPDRISSLFCERALSSFNFARRNSGKHPRPLPNSHRARVDIQTGCRGQQVGSKQVSRVGVISCKSSKWHRWVWLTTRRRGFGKCSTCLTANKLNIHETEDPIQKTKIHKYALGGYWRGLLSAAGSENLFKVTTNILELDSESGRRGATQYNAKWQEVKWGIYQKDTE